MLLRACLVSELYFNNKRPRFYLDPGLEGDGNNCLIMLLVFAPESYINFVDGF